MTIKDKLKAIVEYYSATRQVGHSRAVLEGARATGALVVCHNHQYSKDLQHGNRRFTTTSLENLDGKLRGHNSPLVFDNAAMMDLCSQAHIHILELETKINEWEMINWTQTDRVISISRDKEDLKEKIKAMEADKEIHQQVIVNMAVELYES